MREKGKIAASIMCSGFDQVMDYVHEFERNNIEFLHVDVMDGTFVPNLAYGPDFVKRLRKKTDITLDCHLMVDRAEDKLDPLNRGTYEKDSYINGMKKNMEILEEAFYAKDH